MGTQVSTFVSKLVRHEHSRERETDGAIHWKFINQKLIIRFQHDGGSNFNERDWMNFIWKGSNKTRFQYCQNYCSKLLYLRVVQGHTGGEMIPPAMLVRDFIHHNWKRFVFHSFNLTSILNAGLNAAYCSQWCLE